MKRAKNKSMSLGSKLALGFGSLGIPFFVTLTLLNYFQPLCPAEGQRTPLLPPFSKVNGHAYYVMLDTLFVLGDTSENLRRSQLLVCEDKFLLGPAHTILGDIVGSGGGRFLHWQTQLIFSSSDNTDPNSNGRSYMIVVPNGIK